MDERGREGVMFLLVGWALAADCDPAAVLGDLASRGSRDDYLCVSKAEEGKDLLLAEIAKDPTAEHPRLTRALVLWLLERTDRPMEPAVVAALSPADRRLLADGIRARRGRASPSPEHAEIFANLTWYEPLPGYNDARLRPIDKANIAVVDPAVRVAPPSEEVPAEEAEPVPEKPAAAVGMCGCAAGGTGATGLGLLGAFALIARRRRLGGSAR